MGTFSFSLSRYNVFNGFQSRQTRECGTVVTEKDKLEMEKAVAAANLNVKRQTGNESYDFGIYFNVIASNMTEEGGWVPYVHPLPFINFLLISTGKAR